MNNKQIDRIARKIIKASLMECYYYFVNIGNYLVINVDYHPDNTFDKFINQASNIKKQIQNITNEIILKYDVKKDFENIEINVGRISFKCYFSKTADFDDSELIKFLQNKGFQKKQQ